MTYRLLLLAAAWALACGQAWGETAKGGADISYTLARDAKVTVNILDANGWIVRELVHGQQQKAGPQTAHWDGCDEFGCPMPPGHYTWKLVNHTGIRCNYILSVANSGQPPYRTDDDKGSWGGCHGNPLSVAADEGGLFLTWTMEEGNAVFARTDYDGKAIYKIHASQAWGCNYAAAVCGGVLYRIEAGRKGSFLLRYDANTGRYANWSARDAAISGGRLQLTPPEPEEPKTKTPATKKVEKPNVDSQAVAASAQYVAVSFPGANKVMIFKAGGEKLRELEMDSPKGLAFLPDGRLAVCTGGQVKAVVVESGKIEDLLKADLDAPWGVTVARDGKSLWITDQGQSNQVKQFNLSGKLLATIGQKGGMAEEGRIDHDSFFRPRGIACGTDGHIYVTEDSGLRRISRWAQPSGNTPAKLLREWFGPLGPQKTCWPNLANLCEVYYQNWGIIIQCDVDMAARTWRPVAWYKVNIANGVQPYVFESGGRKYMYGGSSTIYAYDANADRWRPAISFGETVAGKQRMVRTWTDLNGDGQVQDDECQSMPFNEYHKATGLNAMGVSLAVIDANTWTITATCQDDVVRITPARIAPRGLPVYLPASVKRLTALPASGPDGWVDFGCYGITGVMPAADGGFFSCLNGGRQNGTTAWDRCSWNKLVKFDANGVIQWKAGLHRKSGRAVLGDMTLLFRIDGITHGMVFMTDVEDQFPIYTEDGLYLDSPMDQNDMTGGKAPLGPNSMTVESVTGLVADDPKTGRGYLYAGSTEDARIWEITGYDSIRREGGSLDLKTADVPPSAKPYVIQATKPPRKPPIYNDYGNDGFLSDPEWKKVQPLPIVEDGVVKALFYLRYDDQDLWVAAHVWEGDPARNNAQDFETAFTRGDCIDLYFASDPAAAAKRTAAGAGDVRVLMYPSGGGKLYNGTIVAYRVKAAAGQTKAPYEFASPVGSFTMDSVREIKPPQEGKTAGPNKYVTFRRWWSHLGYTCEARIPLAELPELGIKPKAPLAPESPEIGAQLKEPHRAEGLEPGVEPTAPAKGHKIGFDCGVIYSNPGGNGRASRLYWHQDSAETKTVTDLTTEARLYPNLWGTVIVGGRD